jgi:hypothetical protein
MSHTPGPWRLCFDGQIDGNNGIKVCSLPWDSYRDMNQNPEDAANALLIAAAPDLLEACKEAEKHSRKRLPIKKETWLKMCAAIAKAERS